MTTAERYPNFARLTALLNQQKHPRQTLNTIVNFLVLTGSKLEWSTPHTTDIG